MSLKIDPKQMSRLMSQMGIKSEEIPSMRVTIEKQDGSKIVIDNPSVTAIDMQGQRTFQVVGDTREQIIEGESDADIVMKETGASREEADKALKESNGDLVEAIMRLQEKKR